MRSPRVESQARTVQEALQQLPFETAMYVRDLIRGLEAEAGTAQALVARAGILQQRDVAHVMRRAAAIRRERDELRGALEEANAERDRLQQRVDALEAPRARWSRRLSL